MFGGSMFGDFNEDPFFSDMHRRHMQSMQGQPMFRPGFGAMPSPFMALESAPAHGARGHHSRDTNAMQPFGMSPPFGMGFGSMFGNMNNMMANMHQNFEQMSNDPNTHSYSHSSFTSYSSAGAGPPKVYEATSSTRKAPGGVKETRRSVRDTEAGMQKMAIGHHLGDRAHVIERSQNARTKEKEEKQDFHNLEESEAETFDREWKQKTHHLDRHHHHQALGGGRHRNSTPAIGDGRDTQHATAPAVAAAATGHHQAADSSQYRNPTPAVSNSRHDRNLVRRDRSPQRPQDPSHGGRNKNHERWAADHDRRQ